MTILLTAGRSSIRRSTVQRHSNVNAALKRPSSTKQRPESSTSAPKQIPIPFSIPGQSWVYLEPFLGPFRAYGRMQARSPLQTQLLSSLTIYFLGDLSAQLVSGPSVKNRSDGEGSEEDGSKTQYTYEPIRGIRALIIGGISSIPSYKWFMFLGHHFNYSSHTLSLAVKIVVNQTFFTPVFNTYFFGMQSLLTGATLAEAKQRVVDTVPTSWRNSWKVWPAVTAFSFSFVAPQYRSVFAGVVAIGWQTYLSWLNMQAQAAEEMGKRLMGAKA